MPTTQGVAPGYIILGLQPISTPIEEAAMPWINEGEKENCQLSIVNCFGLVLVSVKRRNEVERPERRCLSEASLRRAQRNEVTE